MPTDTTAGSLIKYIQLYLAVIITLGYFSVMAALIVLKVEPTNKEMLLQMVGVLTASVTGVLGYFIGASFGGSKNSDVIAQIAQTPAPIVVPTLPVKVDDSTPIKVEEQHHV